MEGSGCHSFTAKRREQWRAAYSKQITYLRVIFWVVSRRVMFNSSSFTDAEWKKEFF
jgi:hypothetical protein